MKPKSRVHETETPPTLEIRLPFLPLTLALSSSQGHLLVRFSKQDFLAWIRIKLGISLHNPFRNVTALEPSKAAAMGSVTFPSSGHAALDIPNTGHGLVEASPTDWTDWVLTPTHLLSPKSPADPILQVEVPGAQIPARFVGAPGEARGTLPGPGCWRTASRFGWLNPLANI